MDDPQIKVCKIEQPPGLVAVKILSLTEVRQVLVVGEDLDGEGRSMEVVSPRLQGVDDCKECLVIDVIILFSRDEQLGEVGAGVPVTVGVGLKEDGT